MDLILSIFLALAAFTAVVIEYCLTKEKAKRGALISVAIFILIITTWKSYREYNANVLSSNRSDTIRQSLDTIKAAQQKTAESLIKIDTLSNYIKRIDSLGIKRDTNTNMPIIKKAINSNIKSQTNVSSINQKGGQTARDITNNH